jgi:hypothetical protein
MFRGSAVCPDGLVEAIWQQVELWVRVGLVVRSQLIGESTAVSGVACCGVFATLVPNSPLA